MNKNERNRLRKKFFKRRCKFFANLNKKTVKSWDELAVKTDTHNFNCLFTTATPFSNSFERREENRKTRHGWAEAFKKYCEHNSYDDLFETSYEHDASLDNYIKYHENANKSEETHENETI